MVCTNTNRRWLESLTRELLSGADFEIIVTLICDDPSRPLNYCNDLSQVQVIAGDIYDLAADAINDGSLPNGEVPSLNLLICFTILPY